MNSHRGLRQIYDDIGTIHFVGIGGIGMSGIAEVLFNMGYRVQGSDISDGTMTSHLRALGIKIFIGHHAGNVKDCDVVVVSSAIQANNPEVLQAREQNIPVIQRAEMLAELMRFRFGIAVAGTHGKTTTTSLIAAVLTKAGLDPTFVVGGKVNSAGGNARLGEGRYLVAEADESDASFLHLKPMMSVITNIDADHLSSYKGEFELLQRGFIDFIHHLPFYGTAVVCNEDPIVRKLIPQFERHLLSYGFKSDSDFVATNVRFENMKSYFDVSFPATDELFQVMLNLPGRYNILNALAAIAVGIKLDIDKNLIAEALAEFQGIGRRLQSWGEIHLTHGNATLIDDYGHHPTEIYAALHAVGDIWQERRKVLIFQPHRYTRTHSLFDDFCEVLNKVDELILLDVYAAGEKAIQGADSHTLCRAIRSFGKLVPVYVKDLEEIPGVLDVMVRDGDVILTMGAGSISKLPKMLESHFNRRRHFTQEML